MYIGIAATILLLGPIGASAGFVHSAATDVLSPAASILIGVLLLAMLSLDFWKQGRRLNRSIWDGSDADQRGISGVRIRRRA